MKDGTGYTHLGQNLQAGLLYELGGQATAHIIVRVLAEHIDHVDVGPVAVGKGVAHVLELDGLGVVLQLVEEVCDKGERRIRLLYEEKT
jgi:hypothetical protein